MDADDGQGDYEAMGPIVDPPVRGVVEPHAAEPGPDYLLAVADPDDARAALDAADRLVLPDGRATAWLVADRLVSGAWYIALLATALNQDTAGGDFPSTLLKVVLAAGVLILLVDVACTRAAGVRPRRQRESRWSWLAQVLGTAVVVFVLAGQSVDVRALVGVLGAGVLGYAAIPVVRWLRATRRVGGERAPWPAGAQAFALLSLLARVEAIAPERLLGIADLDAASGQEWLERLRAEWSVHGGGHRHPLVGGQPVGLTASGRERLDRMRAELQQLASGVPVG